MLLTLATFLPLLGMVVVLLLPTANKNLIRWTATGFAVAAFVPIIVLTQGYGAGGDRPAVDTLRAEAAAVVAGAPAPMRAQITELLADAKSNTPAFRTFVAADAAHPTDAEKKSLAVRAKLEALEQGGAYKAWHEAWELTLAAASPIAADMRYVEYGQWIPSFNIHYMMGVDGLSMPLIFLTGLLWVLCFVYSFSIEDGVKGYFALFLLLQTGLIGVFCALDFFLFYVFWEIVLLPMYFLIGYWGGTNRLYAAIKFFIYTLVGSVLLLVAMLALYWKDGYDSFNLLTLTSLSGGFDLSFQMWIFMALFMGFAIKVPVFPFHTWLPDAHVQAPTAVSVVLAGVLLKMGGYGFYRFSYTLAPDAGISQTMVLFIGGLGVINIVYGALCAMAQKDFKSLVAYSSVSHMGFVLLGLAAMTTEGIQGSVLQMFNHGVSSAMMFLLVGVLYERAHHRDLDRFGGIGLQMPYYTGFAIIGFFASLGLPGLNGFISEVLVFMGSFNSETFFAGNSAVYGLPRWMVYLALPGVVLTAGYILWTVQRVYMGTAKKEEYKTFRDLNWREVFSLAPLAAMCIIFGVAPQLILGYMNNTLDHLRTFIVTGGGN
ncbi:MAG: NADH-quinone oxidoreductase subunit M [Planctomycetes bacterium]|nr:NADH-quinone oxidoreductase subunit M [Planctomycetota bacterium]